MITENAVTSVAVPEVDGIATNLAFCLSSGSPKGTTASSNVNSGYS